MELSLALFGDAAAFVEPGEAAHPFSGFSPFAGLPAAPGSGCTGRWRARCLPPCEVFTCSGCSAGAAAWPALAAAQSPWTCPPRLAQGLFPVLPSLYLFGAFSWALKEGLARQPHFTGVEGRSGLLTLGEGGPSEGVDGRVTPFLAHIPAAQRAVLGSLVSLGRGVAGLLELLVAVLFLA